MRACEICGGNEFTLIASHIREGDGKIMQCRTCSLIMQDSDWQEEQVKQYYNEEYQSTNSLVTGKVQTPLEHFHDRIKTIQPVFAKIKPLLKPGIRVLDVGCGAGELLALVKPQVKYVAGIELHRPFVTFIRKHLGIDAYNEDINKLDVDQKFDLIISIATLDHLFNPLETLVSIKNLLAPAGQIYLEVPNREEALNYFLPDINRRKFNQFFWHRAHLFYFTRETIGALFQKAGLQVDITCRHEYTLKNYLNWYFLGEPQSSFLAGCKDTDLFDGDSDFETRLNQLFADMEEKFKAIMAETFRGDMLCCVGWVN
jgi:2-polyprenyl-3-methyl-5-hydroxy-6-metoxy-1,4-benzoquinol methylase